jgi:hypothetical protein
MTTENAKGYSAAVSDHGYSFPLSYINILYGSRVRVSGAWSVLRLAG